MVLWRLGAPAWRDAVAVGQELVRAWRSTLMEAKGSGEKGDVMGGGGCVGVTGKGDIILNVNK